jgi:tetratricopeptide (TPR) repeat protein
LAEAYVELAYCNTFPDMVRKPTPKLLAEAHEAIAHALRIDNMSAFAHAVHARIQLSQDFDWTGAEQSFQRALEINRDDPYANFLYGELLNSSGRANLGLPLLKEAMRLDPLSMDMKGAYGLALRSAGRSSEAVEYLRSMLTITPDWPTGEFWLSAGYGDLGRQRESVSEYLSFLKSVLPADIAKEATARLELAFLRSGWLGFLRQDIDLAANPQSQFVDSVVAPYARYWSPYWMAWRYARLGDTDRAFRQLGLAYEGRDHHLLYIDVEPTFRSLRSDSRFQDFRRRTGLSH